MNEEKIRVKCPVCGAVLKVGNTPNLAQKSLKCPVCDTVSKFSVFQIILKQSVPQSEETDFRRDIDEQDYFIGSLKHTGNDKKYQLMTGSNLIGRKAGTSTAQIQIDTEDRYMSRVHAEIIVSRDNRGKYLHYLRNAKNKNSTYVNGQLVKDGDLLVLEGGEILRMGHTELRFELSHNKQAPQDREEGGTEY